jgi:hypothetical protein
MLMTELAGVISNIAGLVLAVPTEVIQILLSDDLTDGTARVL